MCTLNGTCILSSRCYSVRQSPETTHFLTIASIATLHSNSPDVRRESVPHTDVEIVLVIQLPLGPKSVQVKLCALRHPLHLQAQLLLLCGLVPGVRDGLARVEQDARLLGPSLVVVHGHLREVLEAKRRWVE